MPLESATGAPRASVDPAIYIPPALRHGCAGWYPESGKAWEAWNAKVSRVTLHLSGSDVSQGRSTSVLLSTCLACAFCLIDFSCSHPVGMHLSDASNHMQSTRSVSPGVHDMMGDCGQLLLAAAHHSDMCTLCR